MRGRQMPEIPEQVATKAASVQAAWNDRATAIRNDGDLTVEARLKRLAVGYLRAKQEMDDLRESWLGTSASQASTIDRDVFGGAHVMGGDAISSRDAADRASRLENPEEGMRLLRQAE